MPESQQVERLMVDGRDGRMDQQNSNRFEHIIYEFYIYLVSYEYMSSCNPDIKNIAFECHVIHLRNLAYFFAKSKKHNSWHVTEVLADTDGIPLLTGHMTKKINQYASRTTGHFGDERLGEYYKATTSRIYHKAFPAIKAAIESFFSNIDKAIRPELYSAWKDPGIQVQAGHVLCQLNAIDTGRIQILGQSSMMSAPTTLSMCQPAFANVMSLSSLSGFEPGPFGAFK